MPICASISYLQLSLVCQRLSMPSWHYQPVLTPILLWLDAQGHRGVWPETWKSPGATRGKPGPASLSSLVGRRVWSSGPLQTRSLLASTRGEGTIYGLCRSTRVCVFFRGCCHHETTCEDAKRIYPWFWVNRLKCLVQHCHNPISYEYVISL